MRGKASGTILALAMMSALALVLSGPAWSSNMAGENYYGFVHYGGDLPAGGIPTYAEKVKSVGAGWIQSEGPDQNGSRGVRLDWVVPWSANCEGSPPDLNDPNRYNWTSMQWVHETLQEGLDVVLHISPGASSCWTEACAKPTCPPREQHWAHWYTFVRKVVERYYPAVKYFTSVQEADFFYGGTVEQLLGARLDTTDPDDPVVVVRQPESVGGSRSVPPGIVPVAKLAVEDANDASNGQARYVLGALVGGTAQLALVHLHEEWRGDADFATLTALAATYNIWNFPQHPDELAGFFNPPPPIGETVNQLQRDRNLVVPTLHPAVAALYDIYSIHTYEWPPDGNNYHPYRSFLGPEGAQVAIAWLASKLPGKAIWISGTGGLNEYRTRPTAEAEAYQSYQVIKNIAIAHTMGVEWMTYSSIWNILHHPVFKTGWWGLWDGAGGKCAPRRPAADSFRRMAKILPTGNSVTGKRVMEYRDGQWWTIENPADVSGWTSDAVVYVFELEHPGSPGPSGGAAIGWCIDALPNHPSDRTSFTPPAGGCPSNLSVSSFFIEEPSPPVRVAFYDHRGEFLQCRWSSNPGTVNLRQAPFIVTWGSDGNGNCEPDIGELQDECQDNDGDGYGRPASAYCKYHELDPNDSDPAIIPVACRQTGPCGTMALNGSFSAGHAALILGLFLIPAAALSVLRRRTRRRPR